ncbi:MAG: PadR family transcriptional regulator [Candidatus Nanopelagicales bacterium]
MSTDEVLDSHIQELRRGTVVVACLRILQEPEYGYRLLERLEEAGFAVEANTLYPLLRRLEKQSLLTSDWNTDEPRPRKYYTTSAAGRAVADAVMADWDRLAKALDALSVKGRK